MSNLQAAVGTAQLERLPQTIKKKRDIGKLYQEALAGIENFELPLPKTEYCENIYWVFGMVSNDTKRNAKYWMQKLAERGICTRPFFYPMHMQTCLKNYLQTEHPSFPNSERLAVHGFYLPSGMTISNSQISQIAEQFIFLTKTFGPTIQHYG